MLDYIIYFITVCTLQLIFLYGFKKLTNTSGEINWKYIFLVPLFSGIITIECYYGLSAINTLTSLGLYYILFYLVFRKKLKVTFFYGSCLWIIAIFSDLLMMLTASIVTWSSSFLQERLFFAFFNQLIIILIIRNKKVQKFLKTLQDKLTNIKFPYLHILLIIIVISSLGFSLFYTIQNQVINSLCISLLGVSVILLIIFYINKEYVNAAIKETNKLLIKNNEFYTNVVNDYRIMKHNIIHQLTGIKSTSNKEAKKLIDDLISQYNEKLQSVNNIKNMPIGINGIVYEKIYNFNQKELHLEIDNSIESNVFENLTPRNYNLLCEALGVLLDNALQASEKTNEKILMIDMKEIDSSYNIKIINTFNDYLEIEKIGTMKYTTKNTGNGIGLFSLIGRKKLKIKTSIINDLFLNEIIIEKKSK